MPAGPTGIASGLPGISATCRRMRPNAAWVACSSPVGAGSGGMEMVPNLRGRFSRAIRAPSINASTPVRALSPTPSRTPASPSAAKARRWWWTWTRFSSRTRTSRRGARRSRRRDWLTGDRATVVVDFGSLNGGTQTRCAGGDPPSGLAALRGAGFTPTRAAQEPGYFVCRIDGKPAIESGAGADRRERVDLDWEEARELEVRVRARRPVGAPGDQQADRRGAVPHRAGGQDPPARAVRAWSARR
mgnify:CR=1 FL=1